MPIPRVKLEISTSRPPDLTSLRLVENFHLPAAAVLDKPNDNDDGAKVRVFDVRFNSEASARDFYARMKSFLVTRNNLPPGVLPPGARVLPMTGKISFHLCSHDDAQVVSCTTDPLSQYEEIVL